MSETFIFKTDPRRKHAALRINKNGVLEFLAPCGFSERTAEKLVLQSSRVIEKLRRKYVERIKPVSEFCEGSPVFYLGRQVPVCFTKRGCAVLDDGVHVPAGTQETVLREIIKLYRREAAGYLIPRLELLSKRCGIPFRSVSIGGAQSRWGSCSRDGRIRLSWRLMQCTPELIDHVLCHELVHIRHFDHSVLFWKEFARFEPDFAEKRKELRQFAIKNRLLP